MNARNQIRLENLLGGKQRYVAEAIAAQAKESAAELIAGGWDDNGDEYELRNSPADARLLDLKLGHMAWSSDRRILESCIRVHLDDAAETTVGTMTEVTS